MEGDDSANTSLNVPAQGDAGVEASQNDEQLTRFQVELEFIQCLANPFYLNHLAQHGHFEQKEFVNYLKYLLYWKEPQYVVFVKYPACLHMLDLLQEEVFRRELTSPMCAKFVEEQLLLHWQYYAFRKRMATPAPPGAPGTQPVGASEEGPGGSQATAADGSNLTNGHASATAATTSAPNGDRQVPV